MYKWMYDRMVTEYSKKSKEELVQEIMALEKSVIQMMIALLVRLENFGFTLLEVKMKI